MSARWQCDRPWKADDREWFRAHPDRSHRVRRMFPGEDAYGEGVAVDMAAFPLERRCVIVRQIEPGIRQRFPIGMLKPDLPPDDEAFLHAYSDVLVARRTPVSTRDPDVTTLAESYAAASWARPS